MDRIGSQWCKVHRRGRHKSQLDRRLERLQVQSGSCTGGILRKVGHTFLDNEDYCQFW